MPELPEVETTRLGILPHLSQQVIDSICIRETRLRWPIDTHISDLFQQQKITDISRRGKYLIISCDDLKLMIHLGMSGSLRIIVANQVPYQAPEKHDHFDIILTNGTIVRYRDPRRFGALLHFSGDPQQHKLLMSLGPEPLSSQFTLEKFYQNARGKKLTIKQYIMDSHQVVGVGNIYANEALFLSGIRPGKAAGRLSLKSFSILHKNIITILKQAIEKGGTTLKDFVAPSVENNQNQAGYFQQQLFVYDRASKPCKICKIPIKSKKIAQRSSFYCPNCQR